MFCILVGLKSTSKFDLFLYCYFLSGGSSVPFLEVSIVNTTVERGSFFDVRVERFLPNPTVKRLNGTLLNGVVCGYSPKSGLLVDLTEWIGFNSIQCSQERECHHRLNEE